MRTALSISLTTILALTVLLPTAAMAGDENPSFSIPDPQTVAAGAQSLAQARAGDANATVVGNSQEAADTVATVNESVQNGNPEVPLENVDAAGGSATGFAGRTVQEAYAFGYSVETWVFDEVQVKLEEGDFLGNRTHISVQQHGGAMIALAQTGLWAVCRDAVMGGNGPTDCDDASLAGQAAISGNETAAAAADVATNQKDNIVATAAHLVAEAENLICGGPCQ